MKKLSILLVPVALSVISGPALAASGPFFSLGNTDFIVLLAFIVFVGILLYAGVPGKLAGLLDRRAETIKAELAEAKALREEAKAILASYEQKHKEVKEQVDRIVASASAEANAAMVKAKDDLAVSIARRLAAAEEQIAAAEASALREVRERAVSVAVSVAGEVLARQNTAESASASIDAAIEQVGARLH
ncbi:F0F1 ATP synthase subunit B [Pseudogemmobacter sonorensis]|uniref:F0F1 ATP synthase subunit B n=1 Tax=Pseudogemmobacter sonorensis TaxID=2989681 RepID=UPI0036CB4A43